MGESLGELYRAKADLSAVRCRGVSYYVQTLCDLTDRDVRRSGRRFRLQGNRLFRLEHF